MHDRFCYDKLCDIEFQDKFGGNASNLSLSLSLKKIHPWLKNSGIFYFFSRKFLKFLKRQGFRTAPFLLSKSPGGKILDMIRFPEFRRFFFPMRQSSMIVGAGDAHKSVQATGSVEIVERVHKMESHRARGNRSRGRGGGGGEEEEAEEDAADLDGAVVPQGMAPECHTKREGCRQSPRCEPGEFIRGRQW